MRLLDLFCGAGGASKGYQLAGFTEIVGVDIKPQPNYPFTFEQGNVMEWDPAWLEGFDLVHASPPCQRFSVMTKKWGRSDDHPDLLGETRHLLELASVPYVIENVVSAPLADDSTLLCGSMFGLGVRRHRLFETTFEVAQPRCDHKSQGKVVGVYGHTGGSSKRDNLVMGDLAAWRDAMGIEWMTSRELAESIPPAYTRYIGDQFRISQEEAA